MGNTIEITEATDEERAVLARFGFIVGEKYVRPPNRSGLLAIIKEHNRMTDLESVAVDNDDTY